LNWIIFENKILIGELVSTLAVVLVLLLLRLLITRYIKRLEHYPPTTRRRWIVNIHNIFLVLLLILLTVIWMEQLRTITASLMLVAAAIVVATKEFILNVVGFFYRTGNKFISIGDRIEIGSLRGDVVDQTFLGITIIEIGSGAKTHQYTGLTVFIPNSLFLNSPVKNETRLLGDYVFHIINIPLKATADWRLAETALQKAANEICGPYLEEARHSMRQLAVEHSLDAPSADPRISIQISEPERINLVLRIPIQARKRGRLEQDISRKYLMNLEKLEANKAVGETAASINSGTQTGEDVED
jgi:small-conductance mechanosensitive channel